MSIKTAIIFFIIGVGQGYLLTDWLHQKQLLKLKPLKRSKA